MAIKALEQWMIEHKDEITHFRPRRIGTWTLYAYNRRIAPPLIPSQPWIEDNKENHDLIVKIFGAQCIEEPAC